ncbi:antibiotic biosynthesis monooxygenase [Modestobacter sp. I12A-02628]|uniref:Antibiotic biosynthesis monooxygenase n=1 Tax=Goekera deserti TaxID=2497753 RepID=A0A7K3WLK2_9ACTN|nr:putative quinol monooxygenase [Goekera deserti]MPQ99347.1 antibiotic biosynthesis monooxygenase [Goekera deserti]NDI50346.1 antibiotic biosynthesis monooxygenase [Goekera deserti]NEL56403.1 antibiotic biosynthesis monooxygenase [Goekera deserti]
MSVVVVATITPLPGQLEAVQQAFLEAIPQVHAEPGCELYALHRDAETLVVIERWESREALAVHGTAPALTALGPALAGKVAGPPVVHVYDAVPAGDPDKGAL